MHKEIKTTLLAGSIIVVNIHPNDYREKEGKKTLPSFQLPKASEEPETEPRSERLETESRCKRSETEPQSERPKTKPRSERPETEPRSKRPKTEP
jgi:hypothetical protein